MAQRAITILILLSLLLHLAGNYLKDINFKGSGLLTSISSILDIVWITWALVLFLNLCGVVKLRKTKE